MGTIFNIQCMQGGWGSGLDGDDNAPLSHVQDHISLARVPSSPQLTNLVAGCSKCTASVTPWQYLIITSDQRQPPPAHTLPAIRIPQI